MPNLTSLPIIKTNTGIIASITSSSGGGTTTSQTISEIPDTSVTFQVRPGQRIVVFSTLAITNNTAGETSTFQISIFNGSAVEIEGFSSSIYVPTAFVNKYINAALSKLIPTSEVTTQTFTAKFYIATSTGTTTEADLDGFNATIMVIN